MGCLQTKRIRIYFITLLALGLVPFSTAHANSQEEFCSVDQVLSSPDVSIPVTVIGETLRLLKGTLGTMLFIEQSRAAMKAGNEQAKKTLQLIGAAGPLKALARSVTPFMNNNLAALRSIKVPTRTHQFHKGVLIFNKVWTPLSLSYLAFKVVASGVCREIRYLGQCVGRTCATQHTWESADDLQQAWEEERKRERDACETPVQQRQRLIGQVSSKWSSTLRSMKRTAQGFQDAIRAPQSTVKGALAKLKSIQSKLSQLKSSVDKANRAMKPFLSSMKELSKVLNKRLCVTYGIKVKVKAKFWKSKVKKKKFCFTTAKILKGVGGILKPVNKLLNKAAKKILDPVIRKIQRQLPRLQFPSMGPIQAAVDQAAAPILRLPNTIKNQSTNTINAFKNQLQSVEKELKSTRKL